MGGIGLGLGYISPVSTLIKWFPDRPGLATGLAIMGFGGGAMIGGPLANNLMAYFKGAGQPSIPYTMITMGILYFVFMMFGVFTIRVPPDGWKPAGWVPSTKHAALISDHNVAVHEAWKTPQFWLLWVMLFVNVTAGIGILEQAAPMIQDLFKGTVGATAAVGFVGLLSIFNMAGRFFWASTSDFIGRKATYFIFFSLGAVLYFCLPFTRQDMWNSVPLFVGIAVVLLSMYGGGFATIPAYLKDLFGGYNVSAIHGRLLTAWSMAGIIGPLIVNGILDHYVENKMTKAGRLPADPAHHVRPAGRRLPSQPDGARRSLEKYWLKDKNIVGARRCGPLTSTRRSDCTSAQLTDQEKFSWLIPLNVKKSSPLMIACVDHRHCSHGVGLNYTVQNAMKIFTAPTPAVTAPQK